MNERVWTFSNGTEADFWFASNCDRCRKTYDDARGSSLCELNDAIFESGVGDGKISKDIADRLGWSSHDRGHPKCNEFEERS